MVIDWLEWEAKNTGQHIRHQGNDKEKMIGRRRLPVDGFCKETNTVYELQGCLWHGHRCWITKDKSVTQETVAVLLHITDVAEVLLVQVQIHGILVTVGGTSYQSCIDVTSLCFL
jgi:hypothetical protein